MVWYLYLRGWPLVCSNIEFRRNLISIWFELQVEIVGEIGTESTFGIMDTFH